MSAHAGWDKSVPSNTSSIAQGDDDIRSTKSILQAAWEDEHYFTDGSATSAGEHKVGSARAYVGAASAMSNPRTGAIFWLTDEQDIAVAPSGSTFSKLGAIRSSSTNTFTQPQFFSSGISASRVTVSGNTLSLGADIVFYRAAANHVKTDDLIEASEVSTPTLSGIEEISVGTLQVGSGISLTKIMAGSNFIAADVGIAANSRHNLTVTVSGVTNGDVLQASFHGSDTDISNILHSVSVKTNTADQVVVTFYNSNSASVRTVKSQTVKVVGFRY